MRSFTALILLLVTSSLSAQYTWERVAKAEPDECYNGFGQLYIPFSDCNNEGIPKYNHSYPWGVTKDGPLIWIGTGANVTQIARAAVGQGSPLNTPVVVAEYGASQFPGVPDNARSILGDWRPPQVLIYNTVTGEQTNITPDDSLLESTLGLRAVGAMDGVVILGGPTRSALGLNLFAFDSETLEYLGSKTMWRYSNIRRFLIVDGVLYTGVQNTLGSNGSILRWTGSKYDPFNFETVGLVNNDVANLAYHNGRIYAGTWSPTTLSSLASLGKLLTGEGAPSAIWQSPRIPTSGLHRWHLRHWSKVWDVSKYEPDPVIVNAYGIGEMISYEGKLVWGTMNPPFSGFGALSIAYGELLNPGEAQALSNRAFAVFSAFDFEDSSAVNNVELLYGETALPVYTPSSEGGEWEFVPNNIGVAPKHGASGFDNPNNYYFWSLGILHGKLFAGLNEFVPTGSTGADLWVFPDSSSAAELVSGIGLTTPLNEGFRNIISTPNELFIGATNGANLSPDGGWQLIRFQADTP